MQRLPWNLPVDLLTWLMRAIHAVVKERGRGRSAGARPLPLAEWSAVGGTVGRVRLWWRTARGRIWKLYTHLSWLGDSPPDGGRGRAGLGRYKRDFGGRVESDASVVVWQAERERVVSRKSHCAVERTAWCMRSSECKAGQASGSRSKTNEGNHRPQTQPVTDH